MIHLRVFVHLRDVDHRGVVFCGSLRILGHLHFLMNHRVFCGSLRIHLIIDLLLIHLLIYHLVIYHLIIIYGVGRRGVWHLGDERQRVYQRVYRVYGQNLQPIHLLIHLNHLNLRVIFCGNRLTILLVHLNHLNLHEIFYGNQLTIHLIVVVILHDLLLNDVF